MCELTQIGRVVHGHEWSSPAEWAVAVDALADLSDPEIERLAEGNRRKQRS
jgi:hypothetical protein